jgi:8-oxo-dGTP pyrophosphatase MutT (NUDIX family)
MAEQLLARDGDRLVGVDRERVHDLGLLHYCVHLICYVDTSVFLQLRRADRRRNGNRWTSTVSGHIAAADAQSFAGIVTPDIGRVALQREFVEELGYAFPPSASPEYLGEVVANSRGGGEICNCRSLVFRMQVASLPPASTAEVAKIGRFNWGNVIAAIDCGGPLQGSDGEWHALADNFEPVFREFMRASAGQLAAVR